MKAIRALNIEPAVIPESETPASFVHGMVMLTAERHQIAQVGRTAVLPLVNMVDLAPRQRTLTPDPGAAAVDGLEREPLCRSCGAVSATDVDGNPPVIDKDPLHDCVARQPRDRLGCQQLSVGCLADRVRVSATGERLPVDDDADGGRGTVAGRLSGKQLVRGCGGEVCCSLNAALVGKTSRMSLDGVSNRLESFGVELAVNVTHTRFVVDPGPPGRSLTLCFGVAAAVVAAKQVDEAPNSAGEQIDRFFGGRCQEVGIVELLTLFLIELPRRSSKQVDLGGTDVSTSNSKGDMIEFGERR
ncbi:MAG: hypothetical protein OES24_14630 [Acidimicrobiia bacterium]|nr:hypothetical protein [Acidimicrobiia bacterium]